VVEDKQLMTNINQLEGSSLKYDSKEITIKEALDIFNNGHVDFERQRWGGLFYHQETGKAVNRGAGWKLKKGKEYCENVFLNLNLNQIIAIDLPSVIAYCERHKKEQDATYFKKIRSLTLPDSEPDKGQINPKYLIEDAHNTLSYLNAYVNDLFTVKVPGAYKDKKFSKLSSELQDYFLNQKISLKLVTEVTKELLHKNIISVNSSLPWSRQDCRNASCVGNIPSVVRYFADLQGVNGFFGAFNPCVFSKSECEKRESDKLLAQHLFYECTKFSNHKVPRQIDDSMLDYFYYNTQNIDEKLEKRVDSILKTITIFLKDQSSKSVKKGRWSNFWFFVSNCIEDEYKIINHKEVLSEYLLFLRKTESDESKKSWTEFEKTTNSFEQASYYYYWSERIAKELDEDGVEVGEEEKVYTWELRENKIKEWFESKKDYFVENKFISKVRKSKDSFNTKQREESMLNGQHDPEISHADLFDRNVKVEADHVHPFAKGGTTTVSNCRIVARKVNRSKGAKVK
jgi:hypothetical protein